MLACGDSPGGLDTVHAGHAHIHQHHVWAACLHQIDSLRARTRFADNDEIWLGLEEHPQAAPQQRLIVDDQYPDQRVGHNAASAGPSASAVITPPPRDQVRQRSCGSRGLIRQASVHGEPAIGLTTSHEGSVVEGGSFPHADQAMPGLAGRAPGFAVVDHR